MNKYTKNDDIDLFIQVAELGSFSAVAEQLGLTPSGVSRVISRIEDHLGVKLLQRTTRQLLLTQEGETFLKHGRQIQTAIEAMEADVTSTRGKPRGLLRVNCNTAFAKYRLVPVLPEFYSQYPEIEIDLNVDDRRIDIIAAQIDVAIRVGPLGDSSLIARKIGETTRSIYASKTYVQKHGAPNKPKDLKYHNCLLLTGHTRLAQWQFQVNGKIETFKAKGTITCDSADVLLDMVRAGLGIACTSKFLMEDGLEKGALVELLQDYHASTPIPITALMPPGRQLLPRTRAFIDFLAKENI